jgi:PKD repeat protein
MENNLKGNMKYRLVLGIIMLSTIICKAQLSPYSLPPKWYFGHEAGMDFTGGAPVPMAGNTWSAANYSNQEGSTTECLPNSNVLYYSNSCILANGSNVNFGPSPVVNGGGNSSTQGCVAIPNPANPTTSFYYINTQVDPSGGSDCIPQNNPGVWVYPISNVPANSAPTQLTTPVGVGEFIAACSDNADGYNIISHALDGTGSNTTFYIWSISNTGVINVAPSSFSGTVSSANWRYQGGIKINKCNNKIAFLTLAGFEVRNWTPNPGTTGTIGSVICSGATGMSMAYGLEFSPDGNILYMTDLSGALYWYNIATCTGPTVISASNAGTGSSQTGYGNLALGPDDKIYLSNKYSGADAPAIGKFLAVISNPNGTIATPAGVGFVQTGAGAFPLAAANANYPSTFSGLITLGWHNPFLTIAGSGSPTCEGFSYTYKQYYGANIAVTAGSEAWDFGDGNTGTGTTPTHSYATTGTYTVKLSVKDQLCKQVYTSTKSVVVSCTSAPVTMISFDATKEGSDVLLDWVTTSEVNNDYFDVQYSTDGINFVSIGTVKGNGTSGSYHEYSFTHTNPSSGTNYYKLVQYDFNGQKETTAIKAVTMEGVQVSIMPNPSSQNFNVHISGTDHAEIVVIDVLGKEVYRTQSQEALVSTIAFGSDFAKGTYIVKVITNNETKTVKILKE